MMVKNISNLQNEIRKILVSERRHSSLRLRITTNKFNKKKKKGSNGMESKSTSLILSNNVNETKYLNVSVDFNGGHAGVAEWLTHFIDTKGPSGHAGSIPVPSVTNDSNKLDEGVMM